MRDIYQIIGKRLKSSKDAMMFEGFPGSDTVQVLPAGRPSPIINSYLPSGYFELSREGQKNLYVLDTESVQVVDDGASDDSSFLDRLAGGLFDIQWNTSNKIQKNVGFLEAGLKDSIAKAKFDLFDFGRYIQTMLIIIAAILLLWLLNKIL